MTTPTTTPATDEEVESWRPHFPDGSKDIAARLIARIDAERARADKNRDDLVEAEAARDHEHAEMARQASLAVDCLQELRWWESEARARAIRAVVAAQWGVACVLYQTDARCDADAVCWVLADLPTAEQIVDGAA